jgi:hypothetical protein
MMRTVKLKQISSGTVFTLGGVTWKKGSTYTGDTVECTPKYGGQWQTSLEEFLPLESEVSIKAD